MDVYANLPGAGPLPDRATILVVDDDPAVLTVTQETLEAFGFRVLVAESGLEGEDVFRGHQETIEAAMLDVSMPQRNGVDLARILRSIKPGLPVVFVTGFVPGETGMIHEDGQTFIVHKPYRMADVVETIRKALQTVQRA